MENESKHEGAKAVNLTVTRLELEKSKKLYNSVGAKLPDKGAKLKSKIDELETILRNLSIEENDKENGRRKENFKTNDVTATKEKHDLGKCKSSEAECAFSGDKKLPSFSDFASKKDCKVYSCAIDVNSPSFSGYRDPNSRTKLTEAQPLKEVTAKSRRSLQFNCNPVFAASEDSVKKIQHTLVTYPDDTREESDPENLRTCLMTHQRKGLAFLMWREEQDPSGGILADDMGLGKTLTIISLILKQKENDNYYFNKKGNECKGTLIVCLASIIHQWDEEIKKHCEYDALKVLLYHGPKREREIHELKKQDVVLTTYNILMSEKRKESDTVESPIFKLKWERIVLDEAHTIKNHASQTAQAIFSLKSFRKWAVTGTPIHNAFKDIYSLVKFLQFSPFDDYKKFKKLTDDFSESSNKRKNLLIKSIVLRRTKEQVDEEGKPLVMMKNKLFSVSEIELSESERRIYDKMNEKVLSKFDQYLQKSSNKKSFNLLVLLLRLQQCCNHVSLLGKEADDDDPSLDISKTLLSLAIDDTESDSGSSESSLDVTVSDVDELSDKTVKSSKIIKLFEDLQKISEESDGKDKSVIVSQWVSMLEIVAHHLNTDNIKYHMIAGNTKAEDRQKYAEDFNTKSGVKIMLLSLKAGGVGLNLVGANHLFLLDLHWNPALEMQACDRIHRVGQQKDVVIHKYICKSTIEERIKILQDDKRNIASSALHGTKQDIKGMTLDDFKMLFNVKS